MDSPANPQSRNYDRALDPQVKDADLTADEYLRRQGERAKLAIMGAARGVKSAAGSAFSAGSSAAGGLASDYSPLKFVEKRPIVSVAASAVAGFVGVFFWNPNRYKKIKHRLQALERRFKQHEK